MNLNSILQSWSIRRKVKFKTGLKMKITTVLLFAASLQVCAIGMAQKVSLKFKNDEMSTVFKEIEKQTNFSFVYGEEQLAEAEKITISLKNEKLEVALNLIFKDQPLTYTISGSHIILKERILLKEQIDITVTGKVTNEFGENLVGATVKFKGSSRVFSTEVDGSFSLKIPEGGGYWL